MERLVSISEQQQQQWSRLTSEPAAPEPEPVQSAAHLRCGMFGHRIQYSLMIAQQHSSKKREKKKARSKAWRYYGKWSSFI